GSSFGDFSVITLDNGRGWVVTCHHPDILTMVGRDEVEPDSTDVLIGLLGRSKRGQDTDELLVLHVENRRTAGPRALRTRPFDRCMMSRAARQCGWAAKLGVLGGGRRCAMGMDLASEAGDDLRLNNFAWATVLELAQRYGWEPRGTLPPEGWEEAAEAEEPWESDNYGTNDGQLVTAEDAAGIADALQ